MKSLLPALMLAAALAAACQPSAQDAASASDEEAPEEQIPSPTFTDITAQAGIDFRHFNAASDDRLLPETMGSGAAFFDFDGDGLADLYLLNGAPLRGDSAQGPQGALYRNLGEGRFQDVTRQSGLEASFYAMGAAAGDFDNDGLTDLFLSGVGQQRLFRNLGRGRFQDVTQRAGLSEGGFGSGAAWLDYDRDGYLDLFVGRYVEWSADGDIPCSPDGVHRTYCTPEVYPSVANKLYRNLGGGSFKDVSAAAGLAEHKGKALGVVVLDHNQDGWPDIAVANDTVRNFLFINAGNAFFREEGIDSGMAYSESGAARGGMGIDSGDLDGNGLSDVVIGNFSHEMSAYFRAIGNGFFVDDAAPSGIGLPTLMTLAFGLLCEDFNSDGRLDVLIVNGHIEPDIARTQASQSYRQPAQLFWNKGEGSFEPSQEPPQSPLLVPIVGRGLAGADIDADGDLDLVITENGGPARLLRNDHPQGNWIRLRLQGNKSNRSGYGARLRLTAGSSTWVRELTSGRSYLSASEAVIAFGLGEIEKVDRVEIVWPSGVRQVLEDPAVNRLHTVQEP
ncbi:MAG TPA: CRTAC1 family protein [Acidobacteriota bacterium]|nr:CRTAC1 family protein [Acidobacteriota bacterium]